MSERARNGLILGAILVMAGFLVLNVSMEPVSMNRAQAIGAQIKCPVCQGESIADSPAQMARDMMDLVDERVAAGVADQEIIDELLSSYSGALLLDPPAEGSTLALWLAPFVVLIIGVGVILWWRRHPGRQEDAEEAGPSRARVIVGALALIAALAGIVVIAVTSLQSGGQAATGMAAADATDLDEVSNETMEAVIAANSEHPEVDGMRLALAGRYYDAGDFHSAFPHYFSVAQSEAATPQQVIIAMTRLAWMTWIGNGEATTALDLVDQALEIDPGSQVATYMKATILWCGFGDTAGATTLFDDLLADSGLDPDSRAQIEEDAARIAAGEPCA